MEYRIDLQSPLHPLNIKSFEYNEKLVPCRDIYPDGVVPGMSLHGRLQRTKVSSFVNFIEWSKITEDEIIPSGKNRHLSTKFFDHRSRGWALSSFQEKKGIEIGYYFDGMIFHRDHSRLMSVLVTIYHDIVKDIPMYRNLLHSETCKVVFEAQEGDKWVKEFEKEFNKLYSTNLKEKNEQPHSKHEAKTRRKNDCRGKFLS